MYSLFAIQYGGCVVRCHQTQQAFASEGRRSMGMMPE